MLIQITKSHRTTAKLPRHTGSTLLHNSPQEGRRRDRRAIAPRASDVQPILGNAAVILEGDQVHFSSTAYSTDGRSSWG